MTVKNTVTLVQLRRLQFDDHFFVHLPDFLFLANNFFWVKTDSRQLHSRRRRVMLLLANYDKHFWATDRNKNRRLCTYLRLNKCTWFMLLKEIDTCVCQKERSLCSCTVWTTLEFVFAFLLPNNLSTLEPITFHSRRGGTLFVFFVKYFYCSSHYYLHMFKLHKYTLFINWFRSMIQKIIILSVGSITVSIVLCVTPS